MNARHAVGALLFAYALAGTATPVLGLDGPPVAKIIVSGAGSARGSGFDGILAVPIVKPEVDGPAKLNLTSTVTVLWDPEDDLPGASERLVSLNGVWCPFKPIGLWAGVALSRSAGNQAWQGGPSLGVSAYHELSSRAGLLVSLRDAALPHRNVFIATVGLGITFTD